MKRVENPAFFPHERTAHVPPIPPYYQEGGQFMGFPMSQSRLAVPSWSYFFEHIPAARVIEIGANHGGFTICLGIMGKEWDFSVTSFDIGANPRDNPHLAQWFDFLSIAFYQANVFSEPTFSLISEMIRMPGLTVVACDGGDKIKEWNLYSQFLKPGDCILAHDIHPDNRLPEVWGWGEIKTEDVTTSILAMDLWPCLYDEMAYGGWLSYRRGNEWSKQ